MGSKGLGITMINMYCDMIDNEFSPIIAMLEARTSGIKPVITRRVKKELGIYDLLAKKAALEEEIEEIKRQLESQTRDRWNERLHSWSNVVDAEVERRLEELNEPLGEATRMMESLKKTIKLSTAPVQVAALFERLSEEMKGLKDKYSMLPPITDVLKITEEEIALVEEGTRERTRERN